MWGLSVTGPTTRYYPSQDNSYMFAVVSREFLSPPYINDMVVVRIKAPTFVNTQGGEPPYWSTTTRQVRFWSICSNEPQTTGVVRCAADYQTPLRDGYATVVISDPSKRPSNEVLAQHAATWIPWGALTPGDTVYDEHDVPMTNADGVFYQGARAVSSNDGEPGLDPVVHGSRHAPTRPVARRDGGVLADVPATARLEISWPLAAVVLCRLMRGLQLTDAA